MRVAVVGLGYVGLTTSACLAKEHEVFCFDKDGSKLRSVMRGKAPVKEEGLERLIKEGMRTGRLNPTSSLEEALSESEVTLICVGTPSLRDGHIDLSQVDAASSEVGSLLQKQDYHVVAVKSTVIPGTTQKRIIPRLEKKSGLKAGKDFGVCVNPEFLREGQAVKDFLDPSSTGIIVGELDRRSGDFFSKLYSGFESVMLRTDLATAESIKYARNAYLAKDISFANVLADFCEKIGVDYLDVRRGMEMDRRIGVGRFISAGIGYGGSCFKKDLLAFAAQADELNVDTKLLRVVDDVNESRHVSFVQLVESSVGSLRGRELGVLGLAFKPNTDDVRESRALKVAQSLLAKGAKLTVYDPAAEKNAKAILGDRVVYAKSASEAVAGKDAALILTEWPEFNDPRLYEKLSVKVIVDGRRRLDPSKLKPGFRYYGVGYPNNNKRHAASLRLNHSYGQRSAR